MQSLSVGLVFRRAFEVLSQHWISWTVLFTLFSIAPAIVFELIRWQMNVGEQSVLEAMRGLPGEMLITGALGICLNVAAAKGVADIYAGRGTSGSDWAGVIGSLFWPCLGLTILVNLSIGLGLLLLVIPGLFVMVMFSVALPVRVTEGPGVDDAIRRSIALTKGSRWQIFAIILISIVAFFVLSMLNEILIVQRAGFVGAVLVYPVVLSVASVLMAVLPPVMYEELLALKGGRADVTSEVFA